MCDTAAIYDLPGPTSHRRHRQTTEHSVTRASGLCKVVHVPWRAARAVRPVHLGPRSLASSHACSVNRLRACVLTPSIPREGCAVIAILLHPAHPSTRGARYGLLVRRCSTPRCGHAIAASRACPAVCRPGPTLPLYWSCCLLACALCAETPHTPRATTVPCAATVIIRII